MPKGIFKNPEERARKISESKMGMKMSNEFKEKCRKGQLGKKVSLKTRKKMGLSRIGKHHSEESKMKMSKSAKGKNNSQWKGGVSLYNTIHIWVNEEKGKARNYTCEICQKNKAIHWSNIDHKYKKDLKDYKALCGRCHQLWDLALRRSK